MLFYSLLLIVISICVGAAGQIAYLVIVDHELVRTSKGKIKEIQQKAKQFKPESPEYKALLKEMFAENSKMMKQTFKPTIITFVPFLIVFLLISHFFSFAPIQQGVPVQMSLSGVINGTLSSVSNCLVFSNSSSVSLLSNKTSISLPVMVNSGTCTMLLAVSNGTRYNSTLSGLIGATSQQTYGLGGLSAQFSPNPLIIANLPFNIPLVGNQLNWFWTYLILSFVVSITLNRVFIHYKLIS